ncbi:MAG TPA: aldehyde dehydrogenase family protein [Jatrophihabitans sp.]|nr:aldehyde dehydrogenase family protein [Jatrophihabitans sp.]
MPGKPKSSITKVTGSGSSPAGEVAAGPSRVAVRKTYKLYIGGAFPRSESGRSYPVTGSDGTLLAHAAQASRKDVRDAVVAARKAFPGWSGATAYNRGQVLYRIAEMMEGRREQFAAEVRAAEGGSPEQASAQVDAAIDRWVWYAGWTDKWAQVAGGSNPVAGPYFNFSLPEASGVVGIVAPPESSLLGFVSVVAPAVATGNTVVVIAAPQRPLPAVSLAEALATSDLPGGVINLLTGSVGELAPWLAGHRDVNCLDLTGVAPADRVALAVAAADTVKRVFAPTGFDPAAEPGTARLAAFTETKTVWHPMGV